MEIPKSPWNLSDLTIQQIRDRLAFFWINAPKDKLQLLWDSDLGITTKKLVSELHPNYVFSQSQIDFRNTLNIFFQENGLSHPMSLNLMIANFLYSPPGLLHINNITTYFPSWFCQEYTLLYVDENPQNISSSSQPNDSFPLNISIDTPPAPSSLVAVSSDRIYLNRILGLSNLYYIDPDDREILTELLEVRNHLVDLLLKEPESNLEGLFASDLGDRYWALVRSGVQREPLGEYQLQTRTMIIDKLNPAIGGGFGSPQSINHFLAAMLLYAPGSMKVESPEQKIPAWIYPMYRELFVPQSE